MAAFASPWPASMAHLAVQLVSGMFDGYMRPVNTALVVTAMYCLMLPEDDVEQVVKSSKRAYCKARYSDSPELLAIWQGCRDSRCTVTLI